MDRHVGNTTKPELSAGDCWLSGFGTGLVLSVIIAGVIVWFFDPGNAEALYECRRAHDVFACELIATPVVDPGKPE
jgi:hypothetical protein